MTTEATLRVNDKFDDLLFPDHNRYFFCVGGAGSGKSYAIAQKIIIRCLTETDHRFLVIRKTLPALKRSCWLLLQRLITNMAIPVAINKSDLIITFPNGNTIYCLGLDDPEKLKSIEGITGVWIEEATEISELDFEQLDLRVRGITDYYKQIILSFNPISELHWIKRLHFFDINIANQEYLKTEKKTILKTTYLDNKFLDDQYVEKLRSLEKLNKNLYNIYAKGVWGSVAGLIYTNYIIVRSLPKYPEQTFYGLDFGYNNPTALVEIMVRDQEYYISELLYETGQTNSDLVGHLGRLIPDRSSLIYCDSAEPGRIEELRRAGFNAVPSDKDVKAGIDYVQGKMLNILESSANLQKELNSYSWTQNQDGEYLDKPVKLFDHLLDALRYALFTHHKQYIKRSNLVGAFELKDNF